MSEQTHATSQPHEDAESPPVEPVAQPEAQKVSNHAADMLDEIDAILEPNAQAFVEGFQQKGGE